MKKFFSLTTTLLLSILSFSFIFTACAPSNQASGYILADDTNWKNIYVVDEGIDLSGLFLKHYPDVEDQSNYVDLTISKDMIKGFDTSTAGEKQMTIEYKGLKSHAINYTVFEDFEFIVNQTFCIDNNVLVKLDSQAKKATVTKFDSLSNLIENNGTPTELDLDINITIENGLPIKVASFNFENKLFTYNANNGKHNFTILDKNGPSYSSISFNVQPFDLNNLKLPTINTYYQSSGDNQKAIAIFDQTYGVKIYIVDQNVTDLSSVEPDYVLDGSLATLSRTGLINYTNSIANGSINVIVGSENEIVIRTLIDNNTLSYTCSRVAN